MALLLALFLIAQPPTPEALDEMIDGQVLRGRPAPATAPAVTPGDIMAAGDAALLDLYIRAHAEGAYGFSCVPAAYPGGPVAPRYERLREALRARRLRVRALLAERIGIAAIERREEAMRQEGERLSAEVHMSCVPKDAKLARKRFARLLGELETRLSVRAGR